MNTEFMTADTNLPPCLPLPGAMLGAAGEQHRQGYVCPSAGGDLYGGDGGHQRNFICSISHCGTGGGAGAQRADFKRTLRELEDADCSYGCAGRLERQADLCPHSKKLNR